MIVGIFGKGGVGKTTLAASLALASLRYVDSVMVITADPFPGLREVLPDPPSGVFLREIGYEEIREGWKREFGEEVYLLVSSLLSDVDRSFVEYLSEAPGILEQYSVYRVLKEAYEGHHDLVIWDTQAASGVISQIRAELDFYEHMKKAPLYWSKLKRLLRWELNLEELIERWKGVARFVLDALRSVRSVIVTNEDRLSVLVGKTVARELAGHTKFLGFILNRARSNMAYGELSPLLAVVPEVPEPSPYVLIGSVDGVARMILKDKDATKVTGNPMET